MSEEGRVLVEGGAADRRIKYILAALIGVTIGGSVAFGFVLERLHTNTVHNCEQIEKVKYSLAVTLRESKGLSEKAKGLTAEQKAVAKKFYGDALGRLEPKKC